MDFCVKCGKKITKGVFCRDCAPQDFSLSPIEITACPCGRVYTEKRWLKRDLPVIVRDHVGRGSRATGDILIPEKGKKTTSVTVTIGKKKTTLNVTVVHGQCPMCHKRKSEYFEGVLQLRSDRQSVLSRVHALLGGLLGKKEERVFVAKVDLHKNGADLYVSDKRQMRRIALAIHKRFGGTMSEHPTLFSYNHQSSRDLYRLTILLTLPDVEAGDVIDHKDEPILIRRIANRIIGRNLAKNKTADIPSVGNYKHLPLKETTISRIHPHVEAINPDTYQSERLHAAEGNLKTGQKVKVAMHQRGMFLVKA